MLKKGTVKSIGKGRSIDIWHDPWVPSLPGFRTFQNETHSEDSPKVVHDLISDGEWDRIEVSLILFSPREAEAIMNIPVACLYDMDKWMWVHSKKGEFSVQSAYYVQVQANQTYRASISDASWITIWGKLWNANIPLKMKHFGWRALQNSIPVRSILKKRNICENDGCPCCGVAAETIIHSLFTCFEAKVIWYLSPLHLDTSKCEDSSFLVRCSKLEHYYKDKNWWDIFCCLVWEIWLKRNTHYFEKKIITLEKANEKIPYEMCERQSVNKKWSPSAVRYYKINSDVAVFGDNMIGLGGIMRDHLGDVMAATCCLQHGCFEVDIHEALAARHCLTIALDAGLRDLVLETDCSKLYQYLQHGKCETSAFGVIVSDILLLASSFSSISISEVGRDGNCAAHLLARGSIEFGEMRV